MKRWILLIAALLLLFCCVGVLSASAMDPKDFCGEWYSSEDASMYLFQDGIIECKEHNVQLTDDAAFSGAYCFAKDKLAICYVDINGVDEVRELYLVHRWNGDFLCENKDGSGRVYFYRNRTAAVNYQHASESVP